MKVLHPISRWVTLLVLVVTFLPLPARGRSPDALLPDGVCGSPQTMLEASQSGQTPWSSRLLPQACRGVISP